MWEGCAWGDGESENCDRGIMGWTDGGEIVAPIAQLTTPPYIRRSPPGVVTRDPGLMAICWGFPAMVERDCGSRIEERRRS